MAIFGKKASPRFPASKVISVSRNVSGQGVKVLAESNLELVVGRNVIVIDRRTQNTLGYGKVAKTDSSVATLDIVPIDAKLSCPTVQIAGLNQKRYQLAPKRKGQVHKSKRDTKVPSIENMIVRSID